MKTLNKIFAVMALSAAFMLTSCIEETFPEGGTATAEQVGASSAALEGSLNGIPAQMTLGYYVYEDQVHETDMAYPQFMIAMTELLGDMYPLGSNSGYLPWFTLYRFVKACNDVISVVDIESDATSTEIKGMAGAAYAMRAFDYYMLMVCFEPVENIYTNVSKVKGLTVPIVSEKTTNEEAKSNPRVTHREMVDFILSDLDKAEQLLANWSPKDGHLPNLAVAHGIRAKVLLWDEQYAEAAKYARMAINESKASPVTAAQWEDPTSGLGCGMSAMMLRTCVTWLTSLAGSAVRPTGVILHSHVRLSTSRSSTRSVIPTSARLPSCIPTSMTTTSTRPAVIVSSLRMLLHA